MWVCIGVGAIAFVGFIRVRKRETVWKKMFLCVGVFALLGALADISEGQEAELGADGSIERNEAGAGSKEADVILSVPELDTEYEMSVEIPEEKLTEEECWKRIEAAKEEINQTFPGENDSLNEVTRQVAVKEAYQDGLVTAEWSFDDYEVINTDGTLVEENLTEDGTLVTAVCELTCGACRGTYEFGFLVVLPEQTREEALLRGIREELQNEGEKEAAKEFFLPREIDGYLLSWREKESKTAYSFLILGLLLAVGVRISEVEKRQREQKERKMLLTLEYPEIVNKLSLLLGAGMTLNHAWKKVATSYEKERKNKEFLQKPAYEEMLLTCREMESGVGEKTAYEHFGERCELRRYRKLASLLTQNAKKGTRGLSLLLEQESEDAFEERKNTAKKYAEEAGTKLLFPMILMLGIVIAIIMVPAVLSFQM